MSAEGADRCEITAKLVQEQKISDLETGQITFLKP